MKFSLGQTSVKDDPTGFTGTVTARIEYLGGDVQYRVEALSHDGKEVKSEWFHESRLSAAAPAP